MRQLYLKQRETIPSKELYLITLATVSQVPCSSWQFKTFPRTRTKLQLYIVYCKATRILPRSDLQKLCILTDCWGGRVGQMTLQKNKHICIIIWRHCFWTILLSNTHYTCTLCSIDLNRVKYEIFPEEYLLVFFSIPSTNNRHGITFHLAYPFSAY